MAGVKSESSFDLFPQKTRQTLEAGESGHRNAPPPTPNHFPTSPGKVIQDPPRDSQGSQRENTDVCSGRFNRPKKLKNKKQNSIVLLFLCF